MSDSGVNARKSEAYVIWSEWGPGGPPARDKRLAERFPEISSGERAVWIKEFESLDSFLWAIAENKVEGGRGPNFGAVVRQKFPFMDDSALSRANYLSLYYEWHG